MQFGNPLLLLGLLGAAIPIIVHLVNRQRARPQPFPAIVFLLRSKEQHARALKLKRWVLLALRVALFLLLPLAMARPSLDCGGGGADATDDRLPSSVVIVLDDSASMAVDDATAPDAAMDAAWRRTTDRAARIIRDLRAWDEVAVVVASTPPRRLTDGLRESHAAATAALTAARPAWGASDLPAALAVAADIQRGSRQPSQRTIVVSDAQAAAWPGTPAEDAWAAAGALRFEDAPIAPRNCAVTALSWRPSDDATADGVRFDTDVRCWGDAPERLSAALERGGVPIASSSIALRDGLGTASFVVRMDATEAAAVRVVLEPTHGSRADDVRWAAWVPARSVRVLAVNGDPRAVAYNDELFYLRRALEAGGASGQSARVAVVAADGLPAADLEAVDVVVLANVSELPPDQVMRLQRFVAGGGGLLLTAGSRVDAERWNQSFGELLPKPIRDIKVLANPESADAALLATRLAEVDALHPVFRVFDLPGGESVQSVLAYQYLLLVPEAGSEARTLASFGDGAPALVERAIGQGRVLLWTTSIDMDWTDAPIRTAYLPLVRRVIDYLARRAGSAGAQAEVGEAVTLDLATLGADRVAITTPDGDTTQVRADGDRVRYVAERAGVYRVAIVDAAGATHDVEELAFAANVPAIELAPERIPDATLERWAEASAQGNGPLDARGMPQGARPLWPVLLMIALLVIYTETLVSVRRRLWERLSLRWASRARGRSSRARPRAR